MKKLSISLFAALAIVFAVASSFTTKKTVKVTKFEAGWYHVNSGIQATALDFPVSTTENPNTFDNLGSPAELGDFTDCETGDYVCAIQFDETLLQTTK
ncbi:MAG: DUF6520 family protein [Bacteroidota bacterium]